MSSISFELQFEKVQTLRKYVHKLRMMYGATQRELKEETQKLQSVCQHDFFRESNGDYHKPGYYYTCKKCEYFTTYNPTYNPTFIPGGNTNPDTIVNINDVDNDNDEGDILV